MERESREQREWTAPSVRRARTLDFRDPFLDVLGSRFSLIYTVLLFLFDVTRVTMMGE
jgi:hypothetical protein